MSSHKGIMEGIEHKIVEANGIKIHIAEKGRGPIILFLHGFPESWYTWRHQIHALASLGFRAVAPDLRGFGDTDAPPDATTYTTLHVIGDIIGLLDAIGADQVFVVGHDWGALMAWHLALYRPDRVKALLNMSAIFNPRNPNRKPLETLRALYGDDYYICRFQEPGVIETEFAEVGVDRVLKFFLTYHVPVPLLLPKGEAIGGDPATPITLPSWLSEEEIHYYTCTYQKTGFTGGLNYYRCLDRNWELTAAYTGSRIGVPTKFIIGDQDVTYNGPTKEFIHSWGLRKHVHFLEDVVVMKGVGHFIHEEKPDEINQHIHNFFQQF